MLCCTIFAAMLAGGTSPAQAACAAASSAKYPTAIKATSGLVGYWRLNETSGTQACDAQGTAHGTYSGSALLNQTGPLSDLDPSVALDGSSASARVPSSLVLNPLNVSIEAWVRTTNIEKDEQTIARKQGQYLFQVTGDTGYTNGNLYFRVYKPGGSYEAVQYGSFSGANVWKHVAATFDGAVMRIYSDGVEVAARPFSGTLPSTTNDLMIGRTDEVVEPDFFQGRLDEVAIYNRALTLGQVRDHWEKSAPDTSISSAPPAFTNSGNASFSFSSPDAATTSYECKLDAEVWAACTSPKAYSNLGDGSHTFNARAKTTAGFADVTPASHTWRVERLALQAAETLRADGAELRWARFHDGAFTGYEVHRSESSTFTPSATTRVATITDPAVTSFRDTTATPNKTFTYKLLVNGVEAGARTVTLPLDGKAVKTLQPGPDQGRGAYLYTGWECANHGGSDKLSVGRTTDHTDVQRALIAFDVSDIPADATVTAATLTMRTAHTPTSAVTAEAHRATTAWEEGGERGDCKGPGASWERASAGAPWRSPGGDYDPGVEASVSHGVNDPLGFDAYTLTNLVKQWVRGEAPNHGIVFKLSDETPGTPGTTKYVHYRSDDYTSNITYRPKLVVEYTDGSSSVKPAVAVNVDPPATGTDLSGTVTVEAEAGDDRRVEKVEFFDGTTAIGAPDTTPPFSSSWNTAAAADGTHSLTAKATDDAGNAVTSSAKSVYIDNSTKPVVSITHPAASYQAAVLANSPAAYWRLGEAAGATTAADASGNNRNATYGGTFTLAQPSLMIASTDKAVLFKNATTDGIATATGLTGLVGSSITAEAWVDYPATTYSTSADNHVLARGWGSSGGWNLIVYRSSDGTYRAGFQINKTGTVHRVATTITAGRHHLAGTFDGTTMKLFVDGAQASTLALTSAPLNTTANTLIGQTLQTDVTVDEAAVYPSALSATDLQRHYVTGAGIKGSETIKATATAAKGIAKVELLVDNNLFGSATASPYDAVLDTVARALPDGKHELLARATDTRGKVTMSAPVPVWVVNAATNKYNATVATTAAPVTMVTDASPADTAGFDVTITNKAATTMASLTTRLRWRWINRDGAVDPKSGDISIGTDLAAGGSRTLTGTSTIVEAPTGMPAEVDRQEYRLVWDLYDTTANVWYGDKGATRAEHLVTVERRKPVALGLERYHHYDSAAIGAGMDHLVNLASGNSIVRWTPWAAPGRGLSKVVDLTYNSQETHSASPVGNNFSLSISSLVRLGSRLDIHPKGTDTKANKTVAASTYVEFVDGDGTTHRFDGQTISGTSDIAYKQPPGVHLYLRKVAGGDAAHVYALTRPDRVTYFFDAEGYPTRVADANGNEIKFVLEDVPGNEDPGGPNNGPKKRVKEVRDAGDQPYLITYYSRVDTHDPQILGRVKHIQDHDLSKLSFEYYRDGNLKRLVENGDGITPDRDFQFVYTENSSSLPASNTNSQSTRLQSVRDPMGNLTSFTYVDTVGAVNKAKLVSRTDRRNQTTQFSYAPTTRTTTVTPPSTTSPTARQVSYLFDANGQVLEIAEPLGRLTKVAWTPHRHVMKVTEPAVAGVLVTTNYEYDDNGYLTAQIDQIGRRDELIYNLDLDLSTTTDVVDPTIRADANDVSGKWVGLGSNGQARDQSHISQLSKRKDALNNVWKFRYDPRGNLTAVDEPGAWRDVAYEYDSVNGNLTAAVDQNTNRTEFSAFHVSGQPGTVTQFPQVAGGPTRVTRLGYTSDGLVKSVQAPRHASATIGTDFRRYQSVMDYDAFNRLVRQSTPKGDSKHTVLYSDTKYDPNDNVLSEWGAHEAGAEGDVTTTGTRTDYTYDELDRPKAVVLGTGATTGAEDEEVSPVEHERRTLIDYDAAGRVDHVTLPRAADVANSLQHRIFYGYDSLDRVTTTTRWKTTSEPEYEHRCYDAAGNVESVTAPNAGLATISCAVANPFTAKFTYFADHQLKTSTDPEGNPTEYTYDGRGDLATVKDPETGQLTKYSYDSRGQLSEQEEPFRDQDPVITKFVYDGAGNLRWQFSPRAVDHGQTPSLPAAGSTTVAQSDADNEAKDYVTGYEYGDFGQLAKILLPRAGGETRSYIHRSYDSDGNLSAVSLPVAESQMTDLTAEQRTKQLSTYEYFATGWLKKSRAPNSVDTTFDYTPEGWQKLRLPLLPSDDPNYGRQMKWNYFADGSVKREISGSGQNLQISVFAYDRHGNALSGKNVAGADKVTGQVADAIEKKSDPIAFVASYDALDRPALVQNQPITEATDDDDDWTGTAYAYDKNGNLAQRIDNATVVDDLNVANDTVITKGRKATYTYSTGNRFDTFRDHGPNSGDESTANTSNDRLTTYSFFKNGLPKMRKLVRGTAGDLVQQMDWTHYANGLVKTQTTTVPNTVASPATRVAESHDISYVDDTQNARFHNGHALKDVYTLDSANTAAPCRTASCTTTYAYDGQERLTSETRTRGGSPVTTSYTLNAAGSIKQKTRGSAVEEFDYDGPRVLWSKVNGDTTYYGYDSLGRMRCAQDEAEPKPNDCHKTHTVGESDVSGLLEYYHFDSQDRLDQYEDRRDGLERTSTYRYDALDRMVSQEQIEPEQANGDPHPDSRNRAFSYNGLSRGITEEKDFSLAANSPVQRTKTYTYDAGGQRSGMTDVKSPDGVAGTARNFTYGQNPHGSVSLLQTDNGTIQASYAYDAYGQTDEGTPEKLTYEKDADSGQPVSLKDPLNAFRYSSKRFDTGSATTDMGARRFTSQLSSFLSEDSYAGGLDDLGLSVDPVNANRYSLAGGNPVSYIETDGHKAIGNVNQSDRETDFSGNTDGSKAAGQRQQDESDRWNVSRTSKIDQQELSPGPCSVKCSAGKVTSELGREAKATAETAIDQLPKIATSNPLLQCDVKGLAQWSCEVGLPPVPDPGAMLDHYTRGDPEQIIARLGFAAAPLSPKGSGALTKGPKALRGEFSVRDWSGYPAGVPRPSGPMRLLTGAEYDVARTAANRANAKLRRANPELYAGKQIHEIHPVKFGGSPTDPANKIALPLKQHQAFNEFWRQHQRYAEGR
jgi:RHS repeat-associated protein